MFLRKEVEKMLVIPALRIKFYTEQGLCPGVVIKTGRGNERRYSKNDVVRLAIVKELSEDGISLSAIKRFFTQFETADEASKMIGKLLCSKPEEVFHLVILKSIQKPEKYEFHVTRPDPLIGHARFNLGADIISFKAFNLRLIYNKIDWHD